MGGMSDDDWRLLLRTAREMHEGFDPGIVFIGGLAVFLHAVRDPDIRGFIAFTHDGDFMISAADYADLRDIEQVVSNRRLAKGQFVRNGFEFDVYVEGRHDLPVPYEEVAVQSEVVDGVRVASPEHLLVMKQKAQEERGGTPKGDKDEDDMFKLLVVIAGRGTSPERVTRIDDDLVALLDRVCARSADRVAEGNRHIGAQLREKARSGLEAIRAARAADFTP